MEIYKLLSRFDNVKRVSPGTDPEITEEYSARCPVHDDRINSLSVGVCRDGRILLHCHAGCKTEDILQAVGLTMKDLYVIDLNENDLRDGQAIRESEYLYYEGDGECRLKKIRMRNADGSKQFYWQHQENGKWLNGRNGLEPPLYGLRSLDSSGIVFLVEGEKDADTIIGHGWPCVSLPDGAKTGEIRWPEAYNEVFRNKTVMIIPDNDAVGRAFAAEEARHIQPVAEKVCVVDLAKGWPEIPEKGDYSDMVEALGAEKATRVLTDLCQNAQPWTEGPEAPPENTNEEPDQPTMDKLRSYETILKQLGEIRPETEAEYSDKMMGRLYAKIFSPRLRYNVTAKEWYFYNGRYWEIDTGGMIAARNAKILADALLVYAATVENIDFRRFCSHYGQLKYRKTMVEDARSECFISTPDFDRNGSLLNCLNGTIDLSTFELLPHNPEDLISKMSYIPFAPNARSEEYERFIWEIMQGNEAKIRYLQKTLGLALTTDTSNECCWLWYGPTTRNGKGTLTETFAYMLGNTNGYAMTMDPETLAQRRVKDTRQASGDIARLNGCRFLSASEPPKRMLFDAAELKKLIGRDMITARNLHEREFEFLPKFKLFINTNYLPRIQDDTLFTSGRIQVLTFDRHFSEEEQDPGLKERLRSPENIAGIFNWCLEGLRLYRETGLDPPEEVRNATSAYREDSDKISNFMRECMEKTGNNSAAGEVYRKFAAWCQDNGYGTESKGSFFEELRNKGLLSERGMVNGKQTFNIIPGYELSDDQSLF